MVHRLGHTFLKVTIELDTWFFFVKFNFKKILEKAFTHVTKYKCNKIQMEQNTNRTKCKNTKTPKYKYLVF